MNYLLTLGLLFSLLITSNINYAQTGLFNKGSEQERDRSYDTSLHALTSNPEMQVHVPGIWLNDLSISLSPLNFKDPLNWNILYRLEVTPQWKFRSWIAFDANTENKVRADTILSKSGSVRYNIGIGFQRDLKISKHNHVRHTSWSISPFVGCDGYWNSELRKESYETYYGYYYNFGILPLIGVSIEPIQRITFGLEARSNLNFNLQQYSATGDNYDNGVRFDLAEQLRLSMGYRF